MEVSINSCSVRATMYSARQRKLVSGESCPETAHRSRKHDDQLGSTGTCSILSRNSGSSLCWNACGGLCSLGVGAAATNNCLRHSALRVFETNRIAKLRITSALSR